jgi:multiple sugar transport system permease protein
MTIAALSGGTDSPKSGGRRGVARLRRWLRGPAFPYLLVAPALLLMTALIFYPICIALFNSLFAVDAIGNRRDYVGLDNFRDLLAEPTFRAILWQTVRWTAGCVGFTLLLSLPLALLLNGSFPGRRAARAIVLLPWAASLTISSLAWRYIFAGEYGMLNHLLEGAHLVRAGPEWLARPETAWTAILLVGVWVSIPFTTVVLLAGLQSIPAELYEAAWLDGAGPGPAFRAVTLPLLRPVLQVATVLNVIYVFNSFPIIWTLTKGDPVNSTHILTTYLYRQAFDIGDFRVAYVCAAITFLILLAFTVLYVRLQGETEAYG